MFFKFVIHMVLAKNQFCILLVSMHTLVFFFCHPHSAMSDVPEKLDSLQNVLSQEISDSLRVDAQALLSFYMQYVDPLEAESLAKKALQLAQSISYNKGVAAAYYSLASANWIMGNYDQSLEYTLNNLRINEQRSDSSKIVNALAMLGILYNEQNDQRQALTKFLPVFKYWYSKTSGHPVFNSANNVGAAYFHLEVYDSALIYYNIAYQNILDRGDEEYLALCLNNIGGVYRETGLYDRAINYFRQATVASVKQMNKRDEAVSHGNLGKAYMLKNDLMNAKRELLKGYEIASNLRSQKVALEIIEDLYLVESRRGNAQEALKYHEAYSMLKDSLYNKEKLEQIKKLETSYEIEKRERELEIRQQKIALLESDRRIQFLLKNIFGLVALAIIILAMAIWFYQRQRIRKNRELFKAQQSLSQLELEAARLRENELEQELEYKNKALTSYTVNFIQKSELVEEMKSKIDEMRSEDDGKLDQKLRSLKRTLEQNYNIDRDWEDFKLYFEQVHDRFFTDLKLEFPELTNAELKLCSLLRMNLNIKEVANIMAISPPSVKTARHRLRKKLGLKSEQNLIDYLMKFS